MKPRNNDNNEEQIPMQSRNKQTETNEQYEISPLLLKDSENSSKTSIEIQDNDADQVEETGKENKTENHDEEEANFELKRENSVHEAVKKAVEHDLITKDDQIVIEMGAAIHSNVSILKCFT